MKCAKVKKTLPLFCGGELRRAKARKIKSHIARCPHCRREADILRRSIAVVRESMDEAVVETPLSTLWPQLNAGIAVYGERDTRDEFCVNKFAIGFAIVVLLLSAALSMRLLRVPLVGMGESSSTALRGEAERALNEPVPLVEDIEMEGITVVTLETDDPHLKVVWFLTD